MHDVNAVVTEDYVDKAIRSVKQDMKVWLMGTVISVAVGLMLPMVGVVFYLGAISTKLDTAFEVQTEQQLVLSSRGQWMDRRERVEESLVEWAKTQGYVSPTPAR